MSMAIHISILAAWVSINKAELIGYNLPSGNIYASQNCFAGC